MSPSISNRQRKPFPDVNEIKFMPDIDTKNVVRLIGKKIKIREI